METGTMLGEVTTLKTTEGGDAEEEGAVVVGDEAPDQKAKL